MNVGRGNHVTTFASHKRSELVDLGRMRLKRNTASVHCPQIALLLCSCNVGRNNRVMDFASDNIFRKVVVGQMVMERKGSLEHHQWDFIPRPLALQMANVTCRTTNHLRMQGRRGNRLVLCHLCDLSC
jgi:hypothetical protein